MQCPPSGRFIMAANLGVGALRHSLRNARRTGHSHRKQGFSKTEEPTVSTLTPPTQDEYLFESRPHGCPRREELKTIPSPRPPPWELIPTTWGQLPSRLGPPCCGPLSRPSKRPLARSAGSTGRSTLVARWGRTIAWPRSLGVAPSRDSTPRPAEGQRTGARCLHRAG